MALRPRIFISAVSKELRSARQLVANTLQFLGYEPVWQDIFGTEQGDLREMLRKKIDACQGVIHLVGQCYGAEPPVPDEGFGRVSYTQYEALYARERAMKEGRRVWLRRLLAAIFARQRGMEVWSLVLRDDFPADPHDPEPEELARLQAAYRQDVKTDKHIFEILQSNEELEAAVLKIRSELDRLRRSVRIWAAAVILLLILIAGLVGWLAVTGNSRRAPDAITPESANAAFIGKDYAAAFDTYARLSDSDPGNTSYHRRIEECARLGRLEKPFLDHYLALVRRQPNNAMFHNYLGNAYLLLDPQDEDGKAREHYESALRLDPELSLPLENLGILAYREGRPGEAEALFKSYLAVEPCDAQGWVNLGLLYVARVDAKPADHQAAADAESALRKALGIDPGSASACKGLGRLYAALGRKKDALNAYQRSYALNDAQPDVRQQVELLSWESGGARFPSTLPDDLRPRGVSGDDKTAPAAIIVMRLLDGGQFPEAEKLCLEWTKLEPENPLAWRLLGRACERQGRADDARQAFDNAGRLAIAGEE